MQACAGAVVTLKYAVNDSEGNPVDPGAEPMVYVHGSDQAKGLFPKIQLELEGKTIGDSIDVTLQPEDSFGPRNPDLVMVEPRDRFPAEIAEGMILKHIGDDGSEHLFMVTSIKDDGVTVDGNHPLAGKTLVFSATIEMIRPANPGEMENGVPAM